MDVVPLAATTRPSLLARAAAVERRSDPPARAAPSSTHARAAGVACTRPRRPAIQGKARGRSTEQLPARLAPIAGGAGQETPEVHERLEAIPTAGPDGGRRRERQPRLRRASPSRTRARRVGRRVRDSRAGVGTSSMLTGDNRGTAERVAAEAGVDEVRAELLPADKVAASRLRRRATARWRWSATASTTPRRWPGHLGIAMGAAGSDAAIETADIALMADDLAKLPWLVRHSRRTLASSGRTSSSRSG